MFKAASAGELHGSAIVSLVSVIGLKCSAPGDFSWDTSIDPQDDYGSTIISNPSPKSKTRQATNGAFTHAPAKAGRLIGDHVKNW